MEIEFTCTGPLGRTINLERSRWEQKCRTHPELAGNLRRVEQTLIQPDVMTADAYVANRECFDLRDVLPRKRRGVLKVAVEFDAENDTGRVIAAYNVTRLPSLEEEARL